MAATRRRSTDEYKREAVRLASEPGNTVSGVAKELGIDRGLVLEWKSKLGKGTWEPKRARPMKSETQSELERVKRELAKAKMERDIQRKGAGLSVGFPLTLMRAAGLAARRRRPRRPSDTGVRPQHGIAPNVLEREFSAAGPNQRWVADFMYVHTTEGRLYVAVVLDLFSRRIVGWS
jgi:transposase-like protein